MSTPDLIAKIKAVADDRRGDPNTRAAAQRKLDAFRKTDPHLFEVRKPDPPPPSPPPRNPQAPGMQRAPEWQMRTYLDLSLWKKSAAGNLTTLVATRAGAHRMTLFQYKTKEWGWIMAPVGRTEKVFGRRYKTQSEAHRASWEHLTSL